ncbi:hypothetical protein BGW80DRAFT_1295232, partial [Lactifluus volemus]
VSNTNPVSTLSTEVPGTSAIPGGYPITPPEHNASPVTSNWLLESRSKKPKPKCTICGKEYYEKKGLNRHMDDCHSKEEVKCDSCPFTCHGKRKLAYHHKKVHDNPIRLPRLLKLSVPPALEPEAVRYSSYAIKPGDNTAVFPAFDFSC